MPLRLRAIPGAAIVLGGLLLRGFEPAAENAKIREEQSVVVGNVTEVWRLVWKTAPTPYCSQARRPAPCSCAAFSDAQAGELDLVRMRGDMEVDRLSLTPYFEDGRQAFLERSQAMRFGDYNQDGRSTEFFLQTSREPCGRRMGVIVGLGRSGKLHAFGTARNPDKPLLMRRELWDDLRTVNIASDLIDLPCGDHGSTKQVVMHLRATAAGIEASRRTFACTGPRDNAGSPTKLLSDEPL